MHNTIIWLNNEHASFSKYKAHYTTRSLEGYPNSKAKPDCLLTRNKLQMSSLAESKKTEKKLCLAPPGLPDGVF
jgi:hypothetical protein